MDHTKHSQQEASCAVVDGQQNKRNGLLEIFCLIMLFLEHFLSCLLLIRYGFQSCVLCCVCLSVCVFIVLCSLCSALFWLVYWPVCFLKREGKIEGLELGEGEDLGGNIVGATMIRIYCMKIIFKK